MCYHNLARLCLGTALTLFPGSPLQATCPTLDLKTLPTAACATENNPFKASKPMKKNKISQVTFISKSTCPSQIGLRKLLQGVFKGAKEYKGEVRSITPGAFTCTYELNDQWKNALNTKDKELHLDGTLPTTQHVNYLNVPLVGFTCPVLDSTMIDTIKRKQKMELSSTKQTNFTYTLQPRELSIDSKLTHVLGSGSNNSSLPKLTSGNAKITKDYEITCRYEHKTGGEKQELILVGSSKGTH